MKASSWMVLPLVLGLSSLTVACDTAGDSEVEEQEVNEQLETNPTGAESVEGDESEEGGEAGEAGEGEGSD